jgi:hypothetical protein
MQKFKTILEKQNQQNPKEFLTEGSIQDTIEKVWALNKDRVGKPILSNEKEDKNMIVLYVTEHGFKLYNKIERQLIQFDSFSNEKPISNEVEILKKVL